MSVTVAPLFTWATGMRRAVASSTISADVCWVVHVWTISFHSSKRWVRVRTNAQEGSSIISSGRSIITQNASNIVCVFVLNPTYPSRVGSMEGVSSVRDGPVRGGRPDRLCIRSA